MPTDDDKNRSELAGLGIPECDDVRAIFEAAYLDWAVGAYSEDQSPLLCGLHDVFDLENDKHHNCLGCNFAEATESVAHHLRYGGELGSYRDGISLIIMQLYLMAERLDTLFNLIDLDEEYRKENFKILLEVRNWANFIKHPKAFILTHHATYTHRGVSNFGAIAAAANVVIDRKFVDTYYSDDSRNKDLYKKLENKANVLVVFPNPNRLVENFCTAIRECMSLVKDNKVYRDKLQSKATFLDYWVDQPDDSGA